MSLDNKQVSNSPKNNLGKSTKPSPAEVNHNQSPEGIGKLLSRDKSTDTPMTPDTITHLQQTIGNQAVLRLLNRRKDQNSPPPQNLLQRTLRPATVTSKTRFRTNNAGNPDVNSYTTSNLKSNTKIVAEDDHAKQKQDAQNNTWTPAVNKTPEDYRSPKIDGFARLSKITFPQGLYPQPPITVMAGKRQVTGTKIWTEKFGELVEIGDNWAKGGEKVAVRPSSPIVSTYKPDYSDFGTVLNHEQSLFFNNPKDYTFYDKRLREILAEVIAAQNGVDAGQLTTALITDGNVRELFTPLRVQIEAEEGNFTEILSLIKWRQRVFARIKEGAAHTVAAIAHWRAAIFPANPGGVVIQAIDIKGSDLHDVGLGAIQVTYAKPNGWQAIELTRQGLNQDVGMFAGEAAPQVFVKPEDRSIEKALVGDQPDSLANRVNALAGLNTASSKIETIKMRTHQNYGTIIETVRGVAADKGGKHGSSEGLAEGMAFALLAGMQDLHGDNVFWHNGKPLFIDADNALNSASLGDVAKQSGFTKYSDSSDIIRTGMKEQIKKPGAIGAQHSKLLTAILANATPFIQAVQQTFNNKSGRVVPIETKKWQRVIEGRSQSTPYPLLPEGKSTDATGQMTKWGISKQWARSVPSGDEAMARGLSGECGINANGADYQFLEEAKQIKLDLDKGQIPFYHYDYTSGHILHNGQTIWNGQTLVEAMAMLREKLRAQQDNDDDNELIGNLFN